MFNWIKNLFSSDKQKVDSETTDPLSELYSNFSIEYYPASGRYYPKFKNKYLYLNSTTGFYELESERLMAYCEHGRTKQEALKIIEHYISLLPISAKTISVSKEDIKNASSKAGTIVINGAVISS